MASRHGHETGWPLPFPRRSSRFPSAGRSATPGRTCSTGASSRCRWGSPEKLWAAGEGLARGYWSRPRLTAERFAPQPWGGRPGERLYRTGDLVRRRQGGEIEFLGRIDQQVKIRGFRIELGEIETALAADPRVATAVVVAGRDAVGDARLDAYVVPCAGEVGAGLGGELRAALEGRLPHYLVPATVTVLAELPLTPNAKVDRRALPAPEAPRPELEAGFEPPETELELALAELLGEVLGVERIGIRDDFFALGGHSLKATQVLLRVRDAFGVEVPLRRFFEEPNIAGLSVAIAETLLTEAGDDDLAGLVEDEDL